MGLCVLYYELLQGRRNIMKKLLIGALISVATQALTLPAHIQEEAFIAAHLVDKDIEAILDKYSDQLGRLVDKVRATERRKHGVWQFDWLPGYYIKYNVDRVYKRDLVADCIERNGLDLMHTPVKQFYHIKGRSQKLHSLNYVVIVEKVHDDKKSYKKRMSLEQVKQFCKIIEETGHISTYMSNYLRLENDKLSFIDTDGTFNKNFYVRGIMDLLNCSLGSYYEPEALDYIIDRIAQSFVKLPTDKKKYTKDRVESHLAQQHGNVAHAVRSKLAARISHYRNLL